MKAIVLAALLALTSCTALQPAQAEPAKDHVDVSKVDIKFPVDLSGLTAEEKQLFIEDFCKTGCTILPDEVIQSVEDEESKMVEYIKQQAAEITALKAANATEEQLNADLKAKMKATT